MRLGFIVVASAASAGCFPDLTEAPGLVEAARVLAIRVEPVEARPNDQVTFHPLIASSSGRVVSATIAWALCDAPRRLDERRSVANACLSDMLESITQLPGPRARIPSDACRRFGPIVPPTAADEPLLRAADSDDTGGYFQPVRADYAGRNFAFVRLQCGLDSAPVEIARAYAEQYVPNLDPVIEHVTVADEEPRTIAAGAGSTVAVRWARPEKYVHFDQSRVVLTERFEGMHVSWYATAGKWSNAESRVSESESAAGVREAESEWTAPEAPGEVWFWVVVRDARGGVAWTEFSVGVE